MATMLGRPLPDGSAEEWERREFEAFGRSGVPAVDGVADAIDRITPSHLHRVERQSCAHGGHARRVGIARSLPGAAGGAHLQRDRGRAREAVSRSVPLYGRPDARRSDALRGRSRTVPPASTAAVAAGMTAFVYAAGGHSNAADLEQAGAVTFMNMAELPGLVYAAALTANSLRSVELTREVRTPKLCNVRRTRQYLSTFMPSRLSPDAREALIADLRTLLGDRCTTNATQLDHHSHGESWHVPATPDVVVFPADTAEVSAIVTIAAKHRAPVVPFGAGSSLEGHVHAVQGGVSIDCTRMNRVLRVSEADLDATVQAGVTHRQLNKALENHRARVLGRSRRGRDDWRHGGDARLRHDGRALRHDARGGAWADGGARRWPDHPHGRPREEIVRRLRPHAPVRRLRRHARRHHRSHGPAVRQARGGVGRGLPFRNDGRRRADGDRDHPARHSGGAHRTARRGAHRCGEPLLADSTTR